MSKRGQWKRQERGWYTHRVLGGVCRERDGRWYAYPLGCGRSHDHPKRLGPYSAAHAAMAALDTPDTVRAE